METKEIRCRPAPLQHAQRGEHLLQRSNRVSQRVSLEQLPDDILIAIYRDIVRSEGVCGLVLSLGGTSRRLRTLCWQEAFVEEPSIDIGFGSKHARVLKSCFRRMGKHVRKLCLSGLFMPDRDAKKTQDLVFKLLSLTPGLTHLSLAHMRAGDGNPAANIADKKWTPLVVQKLPSLKSLHTLNLSDIAVSAEALHTAVSSSAATLQRLYLCNTLVVGTSKPKNDDARGRGKGPLPHAASVLHPIFHVKMPRLRALDVSHSIVDADRLTAFVDRHPSLAELYVALPRRPPTLKSLSKLAAAHWGRFLTFERFDAPSRFQRRAALAIFDGRLLLKASHACFGSWWQRPSPAELDAVAAALARVPGDACAGVEGRGPVHEGRTPFLSALMRERFDLARRLKEMGADPLAVYAPYPFMAASPAKRWGSPFPFFSFETPPSLSYLERDYGFGRSTDSALADVAAGATALHVLQLAPRSPAAVLLAAEEGGAEPELSAGEAAELLRSLGLAPLANARRLNERPPLHAHAARGSARAVSVLLSLGADPFLQDKRGDNALFVALGASRADRIERGRIVSALLELHPGLVRTKDGQGRGVLGLLESASEIDSLSFEALLNAGAFAAGAGGATAALRLAVAKLKASKEGRVGALVGSLLRDHGADPNARGYRGSTLLMDAIRCRKHEAWQALLAAPGPGGVVDVAVRDGKGRTALHHAAAVASDGGRAFLALLDHAHGRLLDVNAPDRDGRAALHLLFGGDDPENPCTHAPVEMFSKLLERADLNPNLADKAGRSPLFLAVQRKGWIFSRNRVDSKAWASVITLLVGRLDIDANAVSEGGQTPLWHACAVRDWGTVELLLGASGVDVDVQRGPPGQPSPLFLALRPTSADGDAYRGAWRQRAAVRALVARGARPEPADEYGLSVLHYAATAMREDAVQDIIAATGDPRAACALRDPKGRTPLMLACRRGRFGVARELLAHSDAAAQDMDGNGALHLFRSADLARTSASYGAAPGSGGAGAGPGLAFFLELLRACPAAARVRNAAGETPLHAHALREPWAPAPAPGRPGAAEGGRPPALEGAARAFVAASDLLARDAAGRTPLHVAAKGPRASSPPLLRAMLESPQAAAALCAQDAGGATPLHVACALVGALLEAVRRAGPEAGAAGAAGAAAALELRDAGGRKPEEAAPAALRPLFAADEGGGGGGGGPASDPPPGAGLPPCGPFPAPCEDHDW
eukprot:tig00021108_g18335.t1